MYIYVCTYVRICMVQLKGNVVLLVTRTSTFELASSLKALDSKVTVC